MVRLTVRDRIPERDHGRCYVGIVIEGHGTLLGLGGDMPLSAGTTFFVPAASEQEAFRAAAKGPLVVIKCFPPEC